ncbi:hypothetical protein OAF56_01245 [Pirellulaceae bacterium]|jgi:hypothetical protein|nr:hypothetical protein [Pirellulaceae bacterium]MDB4640234.1 hypothetical protein [Pirellulaceae bacterium]MDB4650579.1 hypothetical protein [Pirellulaceae bacterium]
MNADQTKNWPDLAIGLYDRLTGNNAEITYGFEDMHIQVPSGTGANAEHAEWVLNGSVKISTSQKSDSPKS